MRYLVGFVCVLGALMSSPLSAGAEGGEQGTNAKATSPALAIHTQHRLPPQLMLRASYYLYLDADADNGTTSDQTEPNAEEPKSGQAGEEGTAAELKAVEPAQSTEPTRSRLERWHPEAFEDPKKPASEPAIKLEVDSTALEVTPTAPPTLEELERQKKKRRRRGIGIGVGVTLGVAVVGLAIGSAVAMSNFEL